MRKDYEKAGIEERVTKYERKSIYEDLKLKEIGLRKNLYYLYLY